MPNKSPRRRLALIAHDGKKAEMVAFATFNREALSRFELVATESTGEILRTAVGLEVRSVLSGPSGGDAMIAAEIAQGNVRAIIFLMDPMTAHPHETDIGTLLRICNVHGVPIATNKPAADLFMSSTLLLPSHPLD
jgi:methylglyoxal synthase